MKVSLVFLLALLSLAISCSSGKKNDINKTADSIESEQINKISEFINDQKSRQPASETKTQQYFSRYENYLLSVNQIMRGAGQAEMFDHYMALLKDNSEALINMTETLPNRYASETNKKANPNSREYKFFQTKVMTTMYDQLNQARVDKLKKDLDGRTFAQLEENHKKFNAEA